MPTFPTKKSSPARDRLAECLNERSEAEAKISEVNASLNRLANHENEVAEAERSLAELDSAETRATLEWARAREGDAPAATGRARAALTAELNAAAQPLSGISVWSSVAIAQIVCEEVEPLFNDLIDAQRNLAAKIERVGQMREFVIAAAERLPKGSEEARQVYVSAEALANDTQRAMSVHEAPLNLELS